MTTPKLVQIPNMVHTSSATNEHGTPPHVVEAARKFLRTIDLDPASCAEANEVVGAEIWYGPTQNTITDGLSVPWGYNSYRAYNVFLNPPGGKLRQIDGRWVQVTGPGESSQLVWWQKLNTEWSSGRVKQAVFVSFNLEILRLSAKAGMPVQRFHRCYPYERLRFVPLGQPDKSNASPSHPNMLVGLGGTFEDFRNAFGEIGYCE